MILLKDVTAYTVGEKRFDRTTIVETEKGPQLLQRYAAALSEHEKTGLPILAEGKDTDLRKG